MPELKPKDRPVQRKEDAANGSAEGKSMTPPEFSLKASPAQLKGPAGGAASPTPSKDSSFGGEWETPTYDLVSSGTKRGANIELKFKPNDKVDATKIGLIQTAKAINNSAVTYIGDPTRDKHGIKSADAIEIDSATKETDEGTHVDQFGDFANPLYATGAAAAGDTLDKTATEAKWGQHGWRYKDAAKTEQKQDAILKDTPQQNGVEKNSSNIFEVAAVALSGTQKDTYYGSVRWGWKTDAAGNHTKIPFEVISQGVPTSSFLKAGELWNNGKTTSGAETIDMPTVDVQVASEDINQFLPSGTMGPAAQIKKGTRLQVIDPWHAPLLAGTVKVVDGPMTGTTLQVGYQDWGKITDERK
jgi:hypothetical protein